MVNAEKSITLNAFVLFMSGYDDDLSAFLKGFGFSEEELSTVIDELNAYRSIPGTTIARYMNRVIEALADDERSAFLKGVLWAQLSAMRWKPWQNLIQPKRRRG